MKTQHFLTSAILASSLLITGTAQAYLTAIYTATNTQQTVLVNALVPDPYSLCSVYDIDDLVLNLKSQPFSPSDTSCQYNSVFITLPNGNPLNCIPQGQTVSPPFTVNVALTDNTFNCTITKGSAVKKNK